MKDIAKELKEGISSGEVSNRWEYFRRETLISKEYFIKQVLLRYPNMEYVKIFMNETIFIPTFHETLREEKYYIYSVFIDSNVLRYITNDFVVRENNGEILIDLSKKNWTKQIELRNKLLDMSSMILAVCDVFSDDMTYVYRKNLELSNKNISIYPSCFSVLGYEILNKSNFVLLSNSKVINQMDIDNLCLSILEELGKDNQLLIKQKISIYLSISSKLKRNKSLTPLEKEVLDKFVNEEISQIERQNTLLVRSRTLKN